MRISFYAPLKAPDHPVPSGDRQMARLLMKAAGAAGHEVEVVSQVRAYLPEGGMAAFATLQAAASREVEAIATLWADRSAIPDLVFAYHPYYKSPDLIAHPLAERFGLPYLTAEASFAPKQAGGPWAPAHAEVERAIRAAIANLCFTPTDRQGLSRLVAADRLVEFPPFIDAQRYVDGGPRTARTPVELVTVAMMRHGDKARSYAFLAEALQRLGATDWRLTIVGDGPARTEVEAAFSPLPQARLRWLGALDGVGVAQALRESDLFVWPGFNEAYGLSYLEAQACGLPAVAVAGRGTPSVIEHGRTGLLVGPDLPAYAAALAELCSDAPRRHAMGRAAARFVHGERDLPAAAARLDWVFRLVTGVPA